MKMATEDMEAEKELLKRLLVEQQSIFHSLPIAVVTLDATGNIDLMNEACLELEAAPGFLRCLSPGQNYLQACRSLNGAGTGELLAGIEEVLRERHPVFRVEYCDVEPMRINRFRVVVQQLESREGVIVSHYRVVERKVPISAPPLGETPWDSLVQALPAAVYTCNEAGQVTFFNQAAADLWGRQPTLGHDLWCGSWRLFYPDGSPLPLDECPMAMAIREGRPVHGREIVIERQDGHRTHVLVQPHPLRDADGKLSGAINVLFDVSSYRAAEREQSEIRQRLEGIIESTSDAVISKTLDGRVTSWNRAAEKLFGYEASEMIGNSINTLLPEGYQKEERRILEQIQHGESVRHLETMCRRKDGRLIEISITVSPLRNAAGAVIGAAKIARDITERKHAERQAQEQARLLDLASDAIVVADFKSGEIVYWNHGAERLHGWRPDEALGMQITEMLADQGDAQDIGDSLMELGEWSGELRKRTKGGREVIVSSRVTLVRNENDTPVSLLAIQTDITERKLLEAQFLRAQRLDSVGTLASGVAHDLNNILSPIIMSVPVLEEDLKPELKKKILSTILSAAHRGAEIVKQVLMFARGVETKRIPVNCRRLVDEVVVMAQETFPKSITIVRGNPIDVWPVEGDPTQLHQVLLNLTINARDAMPHGGTLTMSVMNMMVDESFASMVPDGKPGPCVVLQVSDNGTGIPKNILDKIFDPFFTTKEIGKGTGLGLSTVVGIVKSHHGFLTVESGFSRGTTFRVFLPAALDSDEQKDNPHAKLPLGNGEVLLLVDDEEAVRVVAGTMLEQAGYKVLLAEDGTEAVAIFAQSRETIRLVITDASMPFLDGAGLTRALQKMAPKIKVIGTSGHSAESDARELRELPLAAFLTKPYEKALLLTTIHQALHE